VEEVIIVGSVCAGDLNRISGGVDAVEQRSGSDEEKQEKHCGYQKEEEEEEL